MPNGAPRHLSWVPDLLTRLALASGVGYLAATYTVSRWLTRPALGRPQRTPADYGLSWEPLECRTADALRLKGWTVAPSQPRGTIALFHGLRSNRAQTLERTEFLVQAGYRCVAFDHRAHGESNGKRTSFGFFEGRDVVAIIELIRRRWPDRPVAALGISMGAAAICYASPRTAHLDALVLESLYHDIGSAFRRRIGTNYPSWLRRISAGTIRMTERRLGVRLDQLAPIDHIEKLAPAPILLLTGTNDVHAPPEDAERLLERCRGPKELWLVPQAGHLDICEAGGEAYRKRVIAFFDRWLGVRAKNERDFPQSIEIVPGARET